MPFLRQPAWDYGRDVGSGNLLSTPQQLNFCLHIRLDMEGRYTKMGMGECGEGMWEGRWGGDVGREGRPDGHGGRVEVESFA
jgi:hypothetical protein